MEKGFIKATTKARGKGTKAVFSRFAVYGIALLQEMVKLGFKREEASYFVDVTVSGLESRFMAKSDMEVENILFFKYESNRDESSLPFHVRLYSGTLTKPKDLNGKEIPGRTLFQEKNDKNWETIILINFEKIRERADDRLSQVE